MTITIIGKNSFLGKALAEKDEAESWAFLSHEEALANDDWAAKASVVFNLSYNPDFKTSAYDPAKDIDAILAQKIAPYNAHYVMASSRLVYGRAPNDFLLNEDMEPAPETTYAQNKYETERTLIDILSPARVTILRMGNIIGFELGRSSFMGMALSGMKEEGAITMDIAPDAVRDFLPVTFWANMVVRILQSPQAGVFNVGSGFGTTTDEITTWLMEAAKGGRAKYISRSYAGQFILDMTKTARTYSYEPLAKNFLKIFVQSLARRL